MRKGSFSSMSHSECHKGHRPKSSPRLSYSQVCAVPLFLTAARIPYTSKLGLPGTLVYFFPKLNISPLLFPLIPCFPVSREYGCTLTSVGFNCFFCIPKILVLHGGVGAVLVMQSPELELAMTLRAQVSAPSVSPDISWAV